MAMIKIVVNNDAISFQKLSTSSKTHVPPNTTETVQTFPEKQTGL